MTTAVADKKLIRPLVTPDGVPLNLELASYGERASAVLIDLFIMGISFAAIAFLAGIFTSGQTWDFMFVLIILAFFVIRSFYFIFFEIRWHGATPGKRAVGIRVIDRKGGVLEPEAVFARNLMREVELYLPMTLFFVQADVGIAAWVLVLNTIWLGIFVLLPLFNRDRLRAGDMIGGTLVIRAPKISLLADPVGAKHEGTESGAAEFDLKYAFTKNQLDVYGVYELQTLEQVLRTRGKEKDEIFKAVAGQIAAKIGWSGDSYDNDCERFLKDFYAASRRHQEGNLLFGKRKRDKFDVKDNIPRPKKEKRPRR